MRHKDKVGSRSRSASNASECEGVLPNTGVSSSCASSCKTSPMLSAVAPFDAEVPEDMTPLAIPGVGACYGIAQAPAPEPPKTPLLRPLDCPNLTSPFALFPAEPDKHGVPLKLGKSLEDLKPIARIVDKITCRFAFNKWQAKGSILSHMRVAMLFPLASAFSMWCATVKQEQYEATLPDEVSI